MVILSKIVKMFPYHFRLSINSPGLTCNIHRLYSWQWWPWWTKESDGYWKKYTFWNQKLVVFGCFKITFLTRTPQDMGTIWPVRNWGGSKKSELHQNDEPWAWEPTKSREISESIEHTENTGIHWKWWLWYCSSQWHWEIASKYCLSSKKAISCPEAYNVSL